MSLMDGMMALGKVDEVKGDLIAAILTQAWVESQDKMMTINEVLDAYERIKERI